MGSKATEGKGPKAGEVRASWKARHLLPEAADFEATKPPTLRRYVVTGCQRGSLGKS